MKKIVVVTGATSTGKTEFAARLAKKMGGELISADSRQVYKYLSTVTGQDRNLIEKIPIHLYGFLDPKKYFSSFDFKKLAIEKIDEIIKRNKTPIIVGGTYLYLYNLLYDVSTEKIKPDWRLRKSLKNKNIKELQEILNKLSPSLFKQLNQSDRSNPQRLIRKIEIASSNVILGTPKSDPGQARMTDKARMTFAPNEFSKQFDVEFIGLKSKNKIGLREAIKERVEKRIKQGAIKEIQDLLKKGYTKNDPGLKTNGARQIIEYLEKKHSIDEMKNDWVAKEAQHAKRQWTFMKRDKNIKWVSYG